MRNKFDKEHILSLCEPGDYGILAPPMKAQTAVNELCRYFLGEDWYDSSGATHPEQVNTAIVAEIEMKYKGAKIKRKREGS
jgi:hypothetical protein